MAWVEIQFGLDRAHTERNRGGEIQIEERTSRDANLVRLSIQFPIYGGPAIWSRNSK